MTRELLHDVRGIWEQEAIVIQRRRQRIASESRRKGDAEKIQPVKHSMVGLSLSGGGIRSALFNLGVLQGLSRIGVFRMVDIMSTVSGGGYIGGCLSCLLSLKDPGEGMLEGDDVFSFGPDDKALFNTKWEDFPLRDRPLAGRGPEKCPGNDKPRDDTWTSKFLPRNQMAHLRNHANYLLPGGSHFFEMLRTAGALSLHFLGPFVWFVSFLSILTLCFMGVITAQFEISGLSMNLAPYSANIVGNFYLDCIKAYFASFDLEKALIFAVSMFVVLCAALLLNSFIWIWQKREQHFLSTWFWIFFLTAFTIFTGMGFYDAQSMPYGQGMPCFLLDFFVLSLLNVIMIFLSYGILTFYPGFGTINSRSFLQISAGSFVWLSGIGLLFALLPLLIKMTPGVILPAVQAGLLGGIKYLLHSFAREKRQPSAGRSAGVLARIKNILFSIFVFLFILLFILIIGQLADSIIWDGKWLEENNLSCTFFVVLGLCSLVFWILPAFNFNRISNHYLYRDRLAEAFFQTSAKSGLGKNQDGISGQDTCIVRKTIRMKLSQLHGKQKGARDGSSEADKVAARGPYHIISATLNLTTEHDLKGLKRKTEPFIFSRLFTGSKSTGYVETGSSYSGLTLVRAITISGAAIAPIMGRMTSRLTSFVCTILGMRLGFWLVNPKFLKNGKRDDKIRYWMKPLFKELLGSANASEEYVYISDGGHSGDNLGIIPLLQRRAKLIIASDAECDPEFAFNALNSSMRQIYVDEGVKIDLRNTEEYFRPNEHKFTQRHYLIGRILYPDRPWQASWLMVLKSSLTGDEMTPILNYRKSSPEFPHETTANQFFNEEQFEAYRSLGRHIAYDALKQAIKIQGLLGPKPWSHIDELCRNIEARGRISGKGLLFTLLHHWDDILAAMWDSEQVDFSSWHNFKRYVDMFVGDIPEDVTSDILTLNLKKLHLWLSKNSSRFSVLEAYPVPRSLKEFCRLQERLSEDIPFKLPCKESYWAFSTMEGQNPWLWSHLIVTRL